MTSIQQSIGNNTITFQRDGVLYLSDATYYKYIYSKKVIKLEWDEASRTVTITPAYVKPRGRFEGMWYSQLYRNGRGGCQCKIGLFLKKNRIVLDGNVTVNVEKKNGVLTAQIPKGE